MGIKYHKNTKTIEIGFEEASIVLNKSKTSMERLLRKGLNQQMMSKKPRTWSVTELVAWYIENEIKNDTRDKNDAAEVKLKEAREEKLQLEIKQLDGSLISIDDADASMSQLAGLLVAQYRQLLVSLPPLLKRKNETEVSQVLDDIFERNIKDLYALAVEEDNLFKEDDDGEET